VRKFQARAGAGLQAYRFALNPTPAQERALRSHCGASRFAFNWAVRRVNATWWQRKAEESYGIPEDQRAPWRSCSLPSLRKDWNQAKGTVAPWWADNSKEAYSSGLAAAARAFDNYAASRNGRRKGPKMGRPRIKSKHRARLSCRFTTGVIRCEPRHAVLPRIGRIRLHEDASKFVGKVEAGSARILTATIRFERRRWFVSFAAETERAALSPANPDAVTGVDLGIKTLAVLSDGREVPNPRHLGGALRKVRRLSRRASRRQGPYDPAARRKQAPSKRWKRASADLARAHGRVADLRRDSTHKLTTGLAREYWTIVVEDLNVAGMTRNRRLARHIADANFGEIRRQLAYKTQWHGGQLIVACNGTRSLQLAGTESPGRLQARGGVTRLPRPSGPARCANPALSRPGQAPAGRRSAAGVRTSGMPPARRRTRARAARRRKCLRRCAG
jgi:putative transposase